MTEYAPPEIIRPPHSARLAREAKALTLLSVRSGILEDFHGGKRCDQCADKPEYSRLGDAEMKEFLKSVVGKLYTFLYLKELDPAKYRESLEYADLRTTRWDDPEFAPFGEVHLGEDPLWLKEYKEGRRKRQGTELEAAGSKMEILADFFRRVELLFFEIQENRKRIEKEFPALYDAWLECELLLAFIKDDSGR